MTCKVLAVLLFTVLVAVWAEEQEKDCSHTHFTPFSVRRYVCGSDGQTYINPQHLEFEKCMNKPDLTMVREGYCDPEEQRRDEEEHRKFMAQYAKEIRKALKEGRQPNYIADLPIPNLDDYPEEDEEAASPAPAVQDTKSSRKN